MKDTLTEKVKFNHLRIGDYFMTDETDHILIKTSYDKRDDNHAWVNHRGIPMLGYIAIDNMVSSSRDTLDEINETLADGGEKDD